MKSLPAEIFFTKEQFEKIKKGFQPQDTQDKWLMRFENGVLHCERSWTGTSVFKIKFSPKNGGYATREIEYNPEAFKPGEPLSDEAVIKKVKEVLDKIEGLGYNLN